MWVIYMHATPMHTETAVLERSQPNDGVGWESNRLLRSGPPNDRRIITLRYESDPDLDPLQDQERQPYPGIRHLDNGGDVRRYLQAPYSNAPRGPTCVR